MTDEVQEFVASKRAWVDLIDSENFDPKKVHYLSTPAGHLSPKSFKSVHEAAWDLDTRGELSGSLLEKWYYGNGYKIRIKVYGIEDKRILVREANEAVSRGEVEDKVRHYNRLQKELSELGVI